MERRDRSLKVLKELRYIDSLDSYEKADSLVSWYEEYFTNNKVEDLDLEESELLAFEELFFTNLNFLKEQKEIARIDLQNLKKVKNFLKN
ncbi:hypothetical protein AAX26_00280 [Aliarcobacter thereius]|uniref:Uncharacterized protein n=1 Tax=Aliarcobacter thereius TaxID=544718 RepID=A0A1C0B9M3_9BACT|nr:hypothetical protein [Aliarcobacter thereius]OCL88594.1 hypothetical protein AAX26_00280 [Aliarcobacter thereius]OCL92088.1 hypothetical protein AAX25_00818 [Aliarcobacter thereius]OCM00263.1 hypothetical protein AAX29_00261 [Aliarcobacter thereius]TLS72469.1 hypothetical protein FE246_03515 [Aliarcobacter thereius]TLT07890.1 hypothetical protein FE243_03920 [Aliarcobacter thereius]